MIIVVAVLAAVLGSCIILFLGAITGEETELAAYLSGGIAIAAVVVGICIHRRVADLKSRLVRMEKSILEIEKSNIEIQEKLDKLLAERNKSSENDEAVKNLDISN